ncbi:hypothetical protein ACP4OV_025524 [Aristida adscensionis]
MGLLPLWQHTCYHLKKPRALESPSEDIFSLKEEN